MKNKKTETVIVKIYNCDGSTVELIEPKDSNLAKQQKEIKKES